MVSLPKIYEQEQKHFKRYEIWNFSYNQTLKDEKQIRIKLKIKLKNEKEKHLSQWILLFIWLNGKLKTVVQT